MSRREIRIAGVQFPPKKLKVEENLSTIVGYIEELAGKNVQLIIFPECSLTGYALDKSEVKEVAEATPGPSTETIQEACRKHSVYAIIGLVEKEDVRIYNAAVMIGPKGIAAKYRKTHLPYQGVDRYVSQGHNPYEPSVTDIGKIGILICYDLFFPETVRALTLMETELIVVPTNWAEGVQFYTDHMVISRALENHINLAAINRVGKEGGFKFYGKSKIVDPSGKILTTASNDTATLLANVNMDEPHNKKIVRIPGEWEVDILNDRRPELYGSLLSTDT